METETETVADVLRELCADDRNFADPAADYVIGMKHAIAQRIQAAHAREVGEWSKSAHRLDVERGEFRDRAERAEAQLNHIHTCGPFCQREMCVARRDAKRYRWLRDPVNAEGATWTAHLSPEELDTAIDAAMSPRVEGIR